MTTTYTNTDSASSLTGRRRTWQMMAVALIFVLGLTADQWTKIWVKTHMYLHESIAVTSWFHINFIENNGMAFGLEFFDKYLLTGFRIAATLLVAYYILRIIRRGTSWGYLICMALIMTGAAGNIIDCIFYGLIFDAPAPPAVAQLTPFAEGYGTWFRGRVVDMLYFPLFEWTWPEWMPLVGGTSAHFFSYIFNIADACISTAVIALLLFYRRTLSEELAEKPVEHLAEKHAERTAEGLNEEPAKNPAEGLGEEPAKNTTEGLNENPAERLTQQPDQKPDPSPSATT